MGNANANEGMSNESNASDRMWVMRASVGKEKCKHATLRVQILEYIG